MFIDAVLLLFLWAFVVGAGIAAIWNLRRRNFASGGLWLGIALVQVSWVLRAVYAPAIFDTSRPLGWVVWGLYALALAIVLLGALLALRGRRDKRGS